MARANNAPVIAHSAAHAATDPAPAPDAVPAPDSPAAAVYAALAANPGGTVTAIAIAAGTSKPATRSALNAMEKVGTATRAKGGKPSAPDTWTLAGPEEDAALAGDTDAGQEAQPGEAPGSPDDATGAEADGGTGQDPAAEAGDPGPEDHTEPVREPGSDSAEADATVETSETDDTVTPDSGDVGTAETNETGVTVTTESGNDGTDGDEAEAGRPDKQPAEPAPEDSQDQPALDTGQGTADGAGDPPDPALVAEASEQVLVIAQAIAGIGTALAAGRAGDALAAIEAIREPAAQARRVLKAATSKRGSGATRAARAAQPRPGALRELVEAHLYKFPDKEFTPHEIGKVLVRSSGAVANALDRLTQLGVAELANEKPRRFRLAPNAPARPDLTDDASQPGTNADPDAEAAPAPAPEPETSPEAETAPAPEPEPAPGADGAEQDSTEEADAA